MISKTDEKILKVIRGMAAISKPIARSRITSALRYKSSVIGFGRNQYKTSTFQNKWKRKEDAIFWHAETNAIYNGIRELGDKDIRELKLTLYVCRVRFKPNNSNGFLGSSIPCVGCQECIRYYGINRVVFSLDSEYGNDQYGVWYPKQNKTINVSNDVFCHDHKFGKFITT